MSVAVAVAVGAALGTGGSPAATLSSDSNDVSGTVNLTAGTTSLTTGTLCTLTLSGNYSSGVDGPAAVRAFLQAANAATAALGIYVVSTTGRVVTVGCTVAPTSAGSYVIFYHDDATSL